MTTRYYPAVLTQAANGSVFTIQVLDLPEAISRGRDAAEAIAHGQAALQLAFGSRADAGESLPDPSPLDERLLRRLDETQRREFKLFYLLPVSEAEPAVRLNISLPGDLVRRIDAVAGNYGRSGWLAEAAREKLARGPLRSTRGLAEDELAYEYKPPSARPKRAPPARGLQSAGRKKNKRRKP